MKFYSATQIGIGKKRNEDRIIIGNSVIADGIFESDIDSGVVAIADGVGGNNAGAIASHFIAAKLSEVETVNLDLMTSINEELIKKSKQNPKFENMATTLSGVFINNQKFTVFNIGNSRVYTLQSGKYLKQLTSDDTTLNYLIKSGQLSQDDADSFDRKSEIIACFGGGNSNLFKIKMVPVEINSSILITSDGIHDYLSIDEMEDIIDEYGISLAACKQMIFIARQHSSCDDASVIIGGIS